MNCAQVKESLIDFLYDELPQDTRASFIEHLEGCPTCKAEVASFGRTLGSARVALAGPLDQEPPARVQLVVVAAAKAAAKQQATPAKVKQPSSQDGLGFFSRLWRTPWFLPAFGAASIATAVFLVRVLKNPEVLPGQHPHSIEERAVVTPEPVAPAATLAPKAAPIHAAEVRAKTESDQRRAMGSAHGSGKRATSEVTAPTATPMVHVKSKKALSDDPLSGLNWGGGPPSAGGLGRFAEPPPPRPAVSKSSKSLDSLLDVGEKERAERRAQARGAPAGGKADRIVSDDEETLDGLSATASAPAKKAPRPEATTEMAKPTVPSITRSAGAHAPAAAPTYAPAPAASPAPAARRERDYPAQPPAREATPSLAKDQVAKGESKDGGPTLDESVRKAERLYASQDWNAAAAAYRDLINRFPKHKDAPKWRSRLNESLVAEEQRQAKLRKAKAKTSNDVLDGLKL